MPPRSFHRRTSRYRQALSALDRALSAAEPSARLVPPRIVRRVIRHQEQLAGTTLTVPHDGHYVIRRDVLIDIVDPAEIGVFQPDELGEIVYLFSEPDPSDLTVHDIPSVLRQYWRRLFHLRIHVEMEQEASAPRLALQAPGSSRAVDIRAWIEQIGPEAFAEARSVLERERLMVPGAADGRVLAEFIAVFCELRRFQPRAIARFFPAIEEPDELDARLRELFELDRLLAETRLEGAAPLPIDERRTEAERVGDANDEVTPSTVLRETPSQDAFDRYDRQARRAEAKGNLIRAAIHWTAARLVAPRKRAAEAHAAARECLDRLIARLLDALDLPRAHARAWYGPLAGLLSQATKGRWSREARLLYDLQKVCTDHERNVYAFDLVGWLTSFGRQPVKRALPHRRDVLVCRHLGRALRRLRAVRLDEGGRQHLQRLLSGAIEHAERRLRERLRPLVIEALDESDLAPASVAERVAQRKLAAELLDTVVERGSLSLGHLRDALARNNLKLPDIEDPVDLWRGDPLLRADRRLAESLRGVYRRGEFYLRWMQQISSLAFGTNLGRLLSRYLLIPFGIAYLAVEAVHHLVYVFAHSKQERVSWPIILLLGFFLVGVINVARFREACWRALKRSLSAARYALVELPRRCYQLPAVQQIVNSELFQFAIKPAVITGIFCLLMPLLAPDWENTPLKTLLIFVCIAAALNTRLGRDAEEIAFDRLLRFARWFGPEELARLFNAVMEFFRAAVNKSEQLLYAVDQWLRFRTGERRITTLVKAVFSVVWALFAYVARFCINLLIEPQINPIKHFPVVTISHKLLLPMIPMLARVLEQFMDGPAAMTLAGMIITGVPGIFGFIVWELKTNWRLYEANRPHDLRPVPIGHHGETLVRLLKPGFHSGTIPKRFHKLRRAESRGHATGRWSRLRRHEHVLHEVEVAVQRFVEREFLELLQQAGCLQETQLRVGAVHLATNRIRVELRSAADESATVNLVFARGGRWLIADCDRRLLQDVLPAMSAGQLDEALAGLYKMAGADIDRRDIDAMFEGAAAHWRLDTRGLVVYPDASANECVYDLGEETSIRPTCSSETPRNLPVLDGADLFLARRRVAWRNWVRVWEQAAEENWRNQREEVNHLLSAAQGR